MQFDVHFQEAQPVQGMMEGQRAEAAAPYQGYAAPPTQVYAIQIHSLNTEAKDIIIGSLWLNELLE